MLSNSKSDYFWCARDDFLNHNLEKLVILSEKLLMAKKLLNNGRFCELHELSFEING